MGRRVCLVTTGQPSTNPRLVKEADALAVAGYTVHVIGASRADWADRADERLLENRRWTTTILDPLRRREGRRSWRATGRYRLARLVSGARLSDRWLASVASPVTPALLSAAIDTPADLYIAHNLGALPAACAAAARHSARLGFDAEDFHSGQFVEAKTFDRRLASTIEERLLPRCDYVTASSPGIAQRYAEMLVDRPAPTVILNVFPLWDRPTEPAKARMSGVPWRLYWFSQTIGADRGLEDAVTAVGLLQRHDVELHLRGEWQVGYKARLRELARRAGLRDGQVVAQTPAAPDEMVRLASRHDVGLALEPSANPNNDLALSNKLFTYLLAGVPFIATATTAQRSLAATVGPAARVVPIGDARAIADAIGTWIEDEAAFGAARDAAWALGTSPFNWDLEQQKFLGIVERVMSGRASSHLRLAGTAS